jgi:putative membrane protein
MKKIKLSNTDTLAIERTRLANERTFLAYFRSSIVFLSSGFAILKINALSEIMGIGYFLLIIAPILFVIGMVRFFYVRKRVRKYFYVDEGDE